MTQDEAIEIVTHAARSYIEQTGHSNSVVDRAYKRSIEQAIQRIVRCQSEAKT